MSTKSIFKFILSNVYESKSEIESIIRDYLKQNGFKYNNNEKCYMIGESSEKIANENVAVDVIFNVVKQNMGLKPNLRMTNPNLHECLEYEIVGNQLVIKAYLLNDFNNGKFYIHSKVNANRGCKEFYNNLQTNLFNKFQENNITLVNVETEKVHDGSSLKLFKKTMIFIAPVILLFTIITIIAYYSSH